MPVYDNPVSDFYGTAPAAPPFGAGAIADGTSIHVAGLVLLAVGTLVVLRYSGFRAMVAVGGG